MSKTSKTIIRDALVVIGVIIVLFAVILSLALNAGVKPPPHKEVKDKEKKRIVAKVKAKKLKVKKAKKEKKKSESQSRAKPAPMKADQKAKERGKKMLQGSGGKSNAGPTITVDYDRIGFKEYIRLMQRNGAVPVLFAIEGKKRKVAAEILPQQGSIKKLSDGTLSDKSCRPRYFDGNKAIRSAVKEAKNRIGPGRYKPALLLPQDLDYRIVGSVSRTIEQVGYKSENVVRVHGAYSVHDGNLAINLRKLVLKDGSDVKVNRRIAF